MPKLHGQWHGLDRVVRGPRSGEDDVLLVLPAFMLHCIVDAETIR
jgi:hypothetical protein